MPPQTNFSYALWNPFIFLTSILLVKTTRKYMNWAQIEEREIKERTAKEITGKIAKVVEEEWREEMEKKNSLRIYRRFKKEMKEEDYSGSLESMVWLRARTISLNLGGNSWQRNRDVCV